jgi:hypothetical protein
MSCCGKSQMLKKEFYEVKFMKVIPCVNWIWFIPLHLTVFQLNDNVRYLI